MALGITQAGLQLEEDFDDSFDHLPTQAFILDLNDDVIEGMIESARQGQEIRLSLGNKPTFLYGPASHHIEPSFEDDTDDLELFLTDATESAHKAERLPQLAMSLFRKPELGNPWAQYRTSSDEEEYEEYEEEGYSDDAEDAAEQQSYDDLDTDIALLRNSLAQKEAEKIEKSTRVIEGNAPAPNGKNGSKRVTGSLQKALSGRRSPFGRNSLSPMPASPALSAIGSPSLLPSDSASQQATDKLKHARSPIIHELAFKEQSYDILWQKYPGASEAEFKTALEKVADLDEDSQNYILRKKYWKELDVWNHDYASDDERQQAIENAVRTFDKMRLSTAEPEWEKLLPTDERGQGRILSKVQVSIAKGPAAPKIRVQKADDSQDSGSNGASSKDDSGDNENSSSRADEDGVPGNANAVPTKKKMSAREAQEKRLLSNKRKNAATSSGPSSTKVSPTKAAPKVSNEKPGKFKSKEFISDSDSSDSEIESAPLSTSVHQSKLSAASVKTSASAKAASKTLSASPRVGDRPQKESATSQARQTKPPPARDTVKSQITAKPLPKKRAREYDDDDSSSSSSSSGAPLSKRIKPVPKALPSKDRKKDDQPRRQQRPPAPARASNTSPNGSTSSASSGNGGSVHVNGSSTNNSSARPKNNNSPIKSSPLASSPPTNASELDLSSEESVPPISSGNTNKIRKLAEERRNKFGGSMDSSSDNGRTKKRKNLPVDLVDKALLFKVYYQKYEALYKDIASRANPPKDKVADLLAMHNRLQEMKSDIHNEAMVRA